MGSVILAGLAGFLAAFLGVLAFEALAARRRWFDVPNDRSSHTRPTPRGAGSVIVLVSLAGLAAGFGLDRAPLGLAPFAAYAAGAALVAALSWIDDLRGVHFAARFMAHGLAAAALLAFAAPPREIALPFLGTVEIGFWGWPLAFLWIVGLTNAYNFMDGIDGIAGTQALLAGAGWACAFWISGSPFLAGVAAVLGGASLGFLARNWSPAKVFMGDVGSAFLGYTFAALPLLARMESGVDPKLPVLGLAMLWPFVFDSLLTFLIRLARRENVFQAHRTHLYQRLVRSGMSHASVTLLYGALSLAGVAAGILWIRRGTGPVLLAIPALAAGLVALVRIRESSRGPAQP